jgi:hypothetical protein
MSRKTLISILAPLLLAATPVAAQPAQPMSDETFNAVDSELSEQAAAQAAQLNPPPPVPAPGRAPIAAPAPAATETPPPIPPYAEGSPIAAPTGGYCYGGPHPIDTRYAPGPTWDPSSGPHSHPYAPIDLRLYAFKDGCYYFIGDPRDFGYSGQTYAYYGAHPVLDVYGGGWCFMIGPHSHFWRPWSTNFVVVGSWYYWEGPYDPFFWSYWPYYSHYYRDYYPHYYRGGYFYHHDHGFRVAPPITRVPPPAGGWHGRPTPGGPAAGTWRGPAAGGGWRGSPSHSPAPSVGGGWRGSPSPSPAPSVGGGWRGSPSHSPAPSVGGGWRGSPSHSPAPSVGGGWRGSPSHSPAPVRSGGGGGWHRR